MIFLEQGHYRIETYGYRPLSFKPIQSHTNVSMELQSGSGTVNSIDGKFIQLLSFEVIAITGMIYYNKRYQNTFIDLKKNTKLSRPVKFMFGDNYFLPYSIICNVIIDGKNNKFELIYTGNGFYESWGKNQQYVLKYFLSWIQVFGNDFEWTVA